MSKAYKVCPMPNLTQTLAGAYTQMGQSINKGPIQEDYWKNKPAFRKLNPEEFANRFAAAYSQ